MGVEKSEQANGNVGAANGKRFQIIREAERWWRLRQVHEVEPGLSKSGYMFYICNVLSLLSF